jgi:predicted transcriptional regulator
MSSEVVHADLSPMVRDVLEAIEALRVASVKSAANRAAAWDRVSQELIAARQHLADYGPIDLRQSSAERHNTRYQQDIDRRNDQAIRG